MRVDFHVHQPSRARTGVSPYQAADYLAFMDEIGVDLSVIFTFDGLWTDPNAHNDELAEWCAPAGGRLIPFCSVDPRRPGADREIERCVTRFGMRGVKFHNWLQGFSPLEPFMEPVCVAAAALGVPLFFHDGTPPYSASLQIAHLAEMHPDLKVVLGHAGLHDLWPEAIAAGRRHPNVYLCMCATPPYAMERIIKKVRPEQLLFGTDGGLSPAPRQAYVDFRWREFAALEAPEPLKAQIVGANPLALLGDGRVSPGRGGRP